MEILCKILGHKISTKRIWRRYFTAIAGETDGVIPFLKSKLKE